MTKIFTKEEIFTAPTVKAAQQMVADNLQNDLRWLIAGLKALYNRQTSDEINQEMTKHSNDRGFSASDAMILTSFTKQILAWDATPQSLRKYSTPLSPRQVAKARQRIAKYAAQLTRVAFARHAVEARRNEQLTLV